MKSQPSDPDHRRWADGWKLAGEFLEEARRLDLAAMDDAAGQRVLRRLSSGVRPATAARVTSGMVAQQRLFRRLAPR